MLKIKEQNKKAWNLYRIFYIAQSTAFIVPVLYIFLQNKFNLLPEEILKISSFYAILSLILELPCALLADRFGSKCNLFICLGLQIASCLSLLLIDSKVSYHVYLICIYTATALCTGASSVLIKKQFFCENDDEFHEYMFNLQNSFYKTTSVFILASSLIYTFYPFAPFILQILNFIVSFICLIRIPEKYVSIKNNSKSLLRAAKEDIYKSLAFAWREKYYAYLIICSIIFGLGIDINHKSIQNQIYGLVSENQVLFIGCTIALGNIFSSYGAKLVRKYFIKELAKDICILVLGGGLIIAYFLMSFNNLLLTVLGFMLINTFKGCYRPILSAELINCYPFKNSLNTNLAIIHIIAVILTSVIQFNISYTYFNIEKGNLSYAGLSLLCISLGYIYSKKTSNWKIHTQRSLVTNKVGFIHKNENELSYSQIYPFDLGYDHLSQIAAVVNSGKYSTKPIVPFRSENQIGITTAYLGDLHLSDILDPEKQFLLCEKLLSETKHIPYLDTERNNIVVEEYIFKTDILKILHKDKKLCEKGVIHGDLNPDNILILNDTPYVIDWDLSGEGPFWYDLLSLLAHPHLYFNKEKKISLFLKYSQQISEDEANLIFFNFCKYKSIQLKKLSKKNKRFELLSKKFDQQSKLFLCNE